jgi:Putative beta-barrel porin-2, OmpL-like. bbp2
MRVRIAALVLATARIVEADPPPPSPTLTIGGYVEAFYQYNFDRPSNLVTAYRAFDDRSNSFTIDNAVLDVVGTVGDVSTHVALQIGNTPSQYYSDEPTYAGIAGIGASDANLWRVVQQAIVAYKPSDLLIEGGIFLSPIGFENLAIKDQWNWSRSNLFDALPFYHAGVRATYPVSPSVTAAVMVTNGWNDIVNRNPYPCVSGVVTWSPTSDVSTQFIYFGGVEPPPGTPVGQPWRNLFDAVASWNVSSVLQLAAHADAGVEPNDLGTTSWFGGAAYVRVHVLPKLFVVARADYLHEHDADGAPRLFFPAATVHSITATADVRPAKNLSVRLEFRDDRASSAMYFRGDVATDAEGNDIATATSQQTLTLGAVSWF